MLKKNAEVSFVNLAVFVMRFYNDYRCYKITFVNVSSIVTTSQVSDISHVNTNFEYICLQKVDKR